MTIGKKMQILIAEIWLNMRMLTNFAEVLAQFVEAEPLKLCNSPPPQFVMTQLSIKNGKC